MKINSQYLTRFSTLMVAGLLATVFPAGAANYVGNGVVGGFQGVIGNGVLSLTDDGTNFSGSLTVGNPMSDALVIYIDTGAAGGFSTTTNFSDQTDGNHVAIAGVLSGSGRSVMTFTNGFNPLYAMSLIPTPPANFGGIWKLANGGNGSFTYMTSVGLSPTGTNIGPFTFSFPASAIGLTANVSTNIKIFGTYISKTGYRSGEAIAGNDNGPLGDGWEPFFQTAFATYTFNNKGATNYPAIFSVDMTAQIANGSFVPGNGDKVYCAGSFQNPSPWSGFQLFPSVGNTNIYTGTNQNNNPAGLTELYKFNFYSVSGNYNVWEFGQPNENRPYTAAGSAQTMPVVYFNDYAARPSAQTNHETFQVDMTSQVILGNFRPGIDLVEAAGTFQTNQWTTGVGGGFQLTNNPTGANTNLYSGTYVDGNYAGTWQQYKFVIVSNGVSFYETINNRTFYTPAGSATNSLGYFNNKSPYTNQITFLVNMTLPLLNGTFSPGNGDTVQVAGTFQTNQWSVGASGFTLTNSPGNTNLYSGTYSSFDQPGTGEFFKFLINSAIGTQTWETPDNNNQNNNRQFVLTTNQTLFADWSDIDPIDYLAAPTTITFTVNLTNALDIYGYPFDPANDAVIINGDFVTPAWNNYASGTPPFFWTDPDFYFPGALQNDYGPGNSYSANSFILNEVGSGLLYSGTYTVPAGQSLQVNYKYGIYHNTSTYMTNCDNEASPNLNHTRYIRVSGTYNFPVDIFGLEQTNQAAATEPPFGNLAIGKPTSTYFPITWLGLPGVHLQYSTNLASTNWVDVTATAGTSATNWPISGSDNQFFRLIQP